MNFLTFGTSLCIYVVSWNAALENVHREFWGLAQKSQKYIKLLFQSFYFFMDQTLNSHMNYLVMMMMLTFFFEKMVKQKYQKFA